MEFVKNLYETVVDMECDIKKSKIDEDDICLLLNQKVQDIYKRAYCYKQNGHPEICIQLFQVKQYFDTIINASMFGNFNPSLVTTYLVNAHAVLMNIIRENEEDNPPTCDFITACKEAIYNKKVIHGENFSKNVYAAYAEHLNGFYLYQMTNIGLIGMTIGDSKAPIPWSVTYSTAIQKYTVYDMNNIPKVS